MLQFFELFDVNFLGLTDVVDKFCLLMLHLVDAPLLLGNLFGTHLGAPLEECLLVLLRRLLTLLSLKYCLLVLFTNAPSTDHLLEQVFSFGID